MALIENSSKRSQIGTKTYSTSTLLIPKYLLIYFEQRVKYYGSRRLYFRHLIISYGRNLRKYGIEPVVDKWKKQYQEAGLDLQIKNFKPEPQFWEEIRNLGLVYGLGICKFFVVLLELEYNLWHKAGCPEYFTEEISKNIKISKISWNSIINNLKIRKPNLNNLLFSNTHTLLIRKMDFTNLKLVRIAIINQE